MNWVSVADQLPTEGKVLVAFLTPFFGSYTVEITVGYYDNPADYENPTTGRGWLTWYDGEQRIKVTHWMSLPELPADNPFDGMKQVEFIEQYGIRPNLGSVFIPTVPAPVPDPQ